MLRILLLGIISTLFGCAAKPERVSVIGSQTYISSNSGQLSSKKVRSNIEKPIVRRAVPPADPPALFKPTVNLSIYHLRCPVGTVSGNDEFWKQVDEQVLDVATYDVLYKNGIRVGRAPLSELDRFMGLLDKNDVATLPTVFAASGTKTIELPMKKGAIDQVLYDFDLKNTMTVRSYEECDNIFVVEFSPAPRKAGDVRVSFCPMVRTLRKRLVAIGDLETREVEYRSPEKFFQLNLKTDIPLDGFLVIGPSPESKSTMSLGHAFFMQGGNTLQEEDVLLIIPQALKRPDEVTAK